MSFAERLEYLLKERKISKAKLLSDLKLGKNQFNYWKNNNTTPNGFTVQAIADYLDCSVNVLLDSPDLIHKDDKGKAYVVEVMAAPNQKEKTAETDSLSPIKQKILNNCSNLSEKELDDVLDYIEYKISQRKR